MAGVLALLAGAIQPATQPSTQPAGTVEPSLSLVAQYLTGSFSSKAQSETQPTYFDIHLNVGAIWADRNDGPWLYVEQARADALNQPYRQRVYHLKTGDNGTYISEVYELPGELSAYVGGFSKPELFANITPQSLVLKQGCEVHLKWDAATGAFVGGTQGQGCSSKLRGATYATSKVTLTAAGMKSWDQGFDAQGNQVWGAVEGPYVFDRK
jgi:CpeT protein